VFQQAHYVIWASDALKKRAAGLPEDLRALLTLPRIWSKGEGGRSVWTAKDHAALVKLTFLARLHTHRSEFPEIGEILGEEPIGLEAFDLWWSLEWVGSVQRWEDLSGELKAKDVGCLKATGLGQVDHWIRNLPQ
jgi:hypothetical protein